MLFVASVASVAWAFVNLVRPPELPPRCEAGVTPHACPVAVDWPAIFPCEIDECLLHRVFHENPCFGLVSSVCLPQCLALLSRLGRLHLGPAKVHAHARDQQRRG